MALLIPYSLLVFKLADRASHMVTSGVLGIMEHETMAESPIITACIVALIGPVLLFCNFGFEQLQAHNVEPADQEETEEEDDEQPDNPSPAPENNPPDLRSDETVLPTAPNPASHTLRTGEASGFRIGLAGLVNRSRGGAIFGLVQEQQAAELEDVDLSDDDDRHPDNDYNWVPEA